MLGEDFLETTPYTTHRLTAGHSTGHVGICRPRAFHSTHIITYKYVSVITASKSQLYFKQLKSEGGGILFLPTYLISSFESGSPCSSFHVYYRQFCWRIPLPVTVWESLFCPHSFWKIVWQAGSRMTAVFYHLKGSTSLIPVLLCFWRETCYGSYLRS